MAKVVIGSKVGITAAVFISIGYISQQDVWKNSKLRVFFMKELKNVGGIAGDAANNVGRRVRNFANSPAMQGGLKDASGHVHNFVNFPAVQDRLKAASD